MPAEFRQTLVEAVQAPDVVRSDPPPAQFALQPEVDPVLFCSFGVPPLLGQQGAIGVADGLQPGRRVAVGQRVLEGDRLAQQRERLLDISLPVFQFPVEHLARNSERLELRHGNGVETAVRHRGDGVDEFLPFRLGFRHAPQGRESDAAGIVDHRRGRTIKFAVRRKFQIEDVLPAPEANENMRKRGAVRLEQIRHRRTLDAEQLRRQDFLQPVRHEQRLTRTARHHRAIGADHQVVDAIDVVPGADFGLVTEIAFIRLDRIEVGIDHPAPVAAGVVDVGGHMRQMGAVPRQPTQTVGGRMRDLGPRRHLHQVDIEMVQDRMPVAPGTRQGVLDHRPGLQRARSDRFSRIEIPQSPRTETDQGVPEQRRRVDVVRELLIKDPHGVRVGAVQAIEFLRVAGRLFGKAWSKRRDQGLFEGGAVAGDRFASAFKRATADRHGLLHVLGVEKPPSLVVVRARAEGDAPVRHGAVGIVVERLFKAADRFLGIEAVRPGQPAIEPELRLG